jgi:hypothetical protein
MNRYFRNFKRTAVLATFALVAISVQAQAAAISTGNAILDRLQGMSNNAAPVAAQYLGVTISEPDVMSIF